MTAVNEKPTTAITRALPVLLGILILLTVYALSSSRQYFSGGTESDFLASFINEAKRLLSGQPLSISHHPPFYTMTIASIQMISQNWILTGLLITWVSVGVTLYTNFRLFTGLWGRAAGFGALFAMASSAFFLAYGSMATSDLFFLALYSSCLYFIYKGHIQEKSLNWALAGFFLGLCYLTRTNAITFLILLGSPFLLVSSPFRRFLHCGLMLLCFALPIAAWALFAKVSGSPFMPTGTHVNLAMTYFSTGADRMSADAYAHALTQFDSLWGVISHDPLRVMFIYVKDLFIMMIKNGLLLLSPLINLLFILGLFLGFQKLKSRFAVILILNTLLQIVLVNLKTYEYRYYFFLVPLIGAIAFHTFEDLCQRIDCSSRKRMSLMLCLIFLLTFPPAAIRAHQLIYDPFYRELENNIEPARLSLPDDALLVARKPHLSYYTDASFAFFPNITGEIELEQHLQKLSRDHAVYLFYGYFERGSRPQFAALSSPGKAPYWLHPVQHFPRPFPSTIYRYFSKTEKS